MKDIDNTLIEQLSSKLISDGHILITIIFHEGGWRDIFITDFLENKEVYMEEIGNTDFIEIIYKSKPFPEYGQIEFDIWLKNKKVIKFNIKKTNRIHRKVKK